MRQLFKIVLLAFALVLHVVIGANAGLSAGDIKSGTRFLVPKHTFAECCPKPEWWNGIQAPTISSKKQLLQIWRSKKHSKLTKAKAFYQAILRFEGKDDDIVATAVSLYGYGDRDYPYRLEMLEYGVARFFDHKRSLKGYSGKVGDTSAGLVIKLAYLYRRAKRPQDAVAIISRMVAKRSSEINDNQLERLSLGMIDALRAMGRNGEALDVAYHAISAYEGSWEKRLIKKKNGLQKAMGVSSYLHGPQLNYLAIGGGLLIILLIGFAVMRALSSRQQGGSTQMRFGR